MKGVGLFRVVGAFSRGEGGGAGVRSWGRRGVVGWIMGVIWSVVLVFSNRVGTHYLV